MYNVQYDIETLSGRLSLIGETVSHFRIASKLGDGTMGVVYRGVDTILDKPVTIRILMWGRKWNEESLARFQREAEAVSKLRHPSITAIYEFGVQNDLPYLVTEYTEGETLDKILKNGPMPVQRLLDIGIQIADALSLAGEKGIIHRDIRPGNIMLTDQGQVKILDFGLAKILEADRSTSRDGVPTADSRLLGTVQYKSPEQELGAELDPRTDIYSTGVVLYEMAAGTPPFTGPSPSAVIANILNQPLPALSAYNRRVAPALEKVITKCLEKKREERYKNASELLAALQALPREIAVAADANGMDKSLPLSSPPAQAPPQTPPSNTSKRQPSNLPGAPKEGSRQSAANPSPVEPASKEQAADSVTRKLIPGIFTAFRKAVGTTIHVLRRLIIFIAWGYSAACIVLFSTQFFRPGAFKSLGPVLTWLHILTEPAVNYLTSVLAFKTIYLNFNFLFVGLAIAVWILQLAITAPLGWLESRIYDPLQLRGKNTNILQSPSGPVASYGTRTSLLREYAASKRLLSDVKREMAFLALDVVGSTKMKIGEDKISIEHAFSEYKKFLERIFRECNCYKSAWTPDGVMTCFLSVDEAAAAGKKLLTDLDWFNTDVHQLRTKFQVRCGLNLGEVLFPDDKQLQEISDEAIDLAGHLQKYADPDTLWVSKETYERLQDHSGFIPTDKKVDNHDVFVWQKPA